MTTEEAILAVVSSDKCNLIDAIFPQFKKRRTAETADLFYGQCLVIALHDI